MLTTAALAEIAAEMNEREADPMPVYQCFKCGHAIASGRRVPMPEPRPLNISHGLCSPCAEWISNDFFRRRNQQPNHPV